MICGKITEEERDEIKQLQQRKLALQELLGAVVKITDETEREYMYERLVLDMAKTAGAYKDWWDRMAARYEWRNEAGKSWSLNFATCEVSLNT